MNFEPYLVFGELESVFKLIKNKKALSYLLVWLHDEDITQYELIASFESAQWKCNPPGSSRNLILNLKAPAQNTWRGDKISYQQVAWR